MPKYFAQKNRDRVFVLLLVIFFTHLLFRIYSYRENYLKKFDPQYWKTRYEMSQWSTKRACSDPDPHINPRTCMWDDAWEATNKNLDQQLIKKNDLGDDGLYAYVGWEYIKGHDPTTLNAEMPPFGKYLIGASIITFGNQNIFAIITGILALLGFFLLNLFVVKDRLLALLPVAAFSFEPLFYTQLQAPYLDSLYLALLFFTFLFLIRKNYVTSAIFLALMASTKSSLVTFVLVIGSSLIYLGSRELQVKNNKKFGEIKKYLLALPVVSVIFLTTYIVYFLNGNNLRQFLGVQKWILNFYTSGAKGTIEAVWQMLFTGKYTTWFGTVEQVTEWHIGWVIGLLFTFYEIYKLLRYRKFDEKSIILIWIIAYLAFLSYAPVWPRYLLLLLPFMYNLAIWRLAKGISRI